MLEQYRELFDDDTHLARTLAVSPATLYRWLADAPMGTSAMRLLLVLTTLAREQPVLHMALVAAYRKPAKPVPLRLTKNTMVRPVRVARAPEPVQAPIRYETHTPVRPAVYTVAKYELCMYDEMMYQMSEAEKEEFMSNLVETRPGRSC